MAWDQRREVATTTAKEALLELEKQYWQAIKDKDRDSCYGRNGARRIAVPSCSCEYMFHC
jgi:hypothetical protein